LIRVWRQNADMSRLNDAQDTVEYIPFEEFRHGLPQGRFRVIVNPVKTQAPRILLHLATRVPSVYEQATGHGVMEVRRA
jgi:hypothetical protein